MSYYWCLQGLLPLQEDTAQNRTVPLSAFGNFLRKIDATVLVLHLCVRYCCCHFDISPPPPPGT